ncbi:hypothetical protein NOVA_27350 [Nocardia nova]|uniref:hypothetical protein n=1 Tax=Nocardia nova TaxID=37330 RepID=UPI001C46C583|nr:hypothetical protein [Nocardia nova]MBV7706508.1 hypothetical protein [Nocardia nova]
MTNSENVDFLHHGRGLGKSPLQVVSSAFERLIDQPPPADPPPALDVALRSWGQVREQLRASLPSAAIDAIWGWLIESARQSWGERGGHVELSCTGLALPMLTGMAGRFAAVGGVDREDAEAEIVAGFLRQLRQIDLDRPHLWSRLWSATAHAGRSWARAQHMAPPVLGLDDDPTEGYAVARTPSGHPELVLADAVAEGVITAEAADLVVLTRLERRTLTSLADERKGTRSHWTVRKQRQRAEHALAAWLAARALDPGLTSVVEAHVVNEPTPRGSHRPAERPREKHPSNGQTSSLATGLSTRPPLSPTVQEARRCA